MSEANLTIVGTSVALGENTEFGPDCRVGHGSFIGYPAAGTPPDAPTRIGARCSIGCSCVIEAGATLGDDVVVDHYVRVGPRSVVGEGTRLLYGCRIHEDVTIGRHCRISGNCPDRTKIGDHVTHFGRLHHPYRTPWGGWDETIEQSMTIGSGTVVAANATLIGEIEIGHSVYVAAGEVVRSSVPDRSVVYGGAIIPAEEWTGRLASSGFFDGPGD